jgi:hypothetical protein
MRASRFPLHLPLLYRPIGQPDWRDGTIENISHSGVLFRVDDVLQLNTGVEFRLRLPGTPAANGTPEVSCRGRVVRAIPGADDHPAPELAVAIEEYDFVRPPTEH